MEGVSSREQRLASCVASLLRLLPHLSLFLILLQYHHLNRLLIILDRRYTSLLLPAEGASKTLLLPSHIRQGRASSTIPADFGEVKNTTPSKNDSFYS